LKFTLQWRGHNIIGKGSYLAPWKQITEFACGVSERLKERFPPEELLEAMDIVNPALWKQSRDPSFKSGTSLNLQQTNSICS